MNIKIANFSGPLAQVRYFFQSAFFFFADLRVRVAHQALNAANIGTQAMDALGLGVIKHLTKYNRQVSVETSHTFFQQSHGRGELKQTLY